MKGIEFEQVNVTLSPPEGMTEEDCCSLPTHYDRERNVYTACFALAPEELQAIALTGKIWLQVMSSDFPPVCLRLDNPFEPDGVVREAVAPAKKDTGRIYEQMVRVRVGQWIVRGWLHAEEDMDHKTLVAREAEFGLVANEILACLGQHFGYARAIADRLGYVNAIEVLGPDGNGALAYNDWP